MLKKQTRQLVLLFFDIIIINISFFLAYFLRFEGQIFVSENATAFFDVYKQNFVVITAIKVIVFYAFKMYNSLWRYASVDELFQVLLAGVFGTAATLSYITMIGAYIPRSVYIITFMIDILFIGGLRFSYRSLRILRDIRSTKISGKEKRVLIIGAGEAGATIIKEIKNHPEQHYKLMGIIDDDTSKKGRFISGVPVLGNRDIIPETIKQKQIDDIIIAIPSASKGDIREIVDICSPYKINLKILPGVYELIDGKVTINEIRNVDIEDLLGRETVALDTEGIESFISGQSVFVTGAGGSIGSELCRQIIKYNPRKLTLLDIYENNIYDLQLELKRHYPNIDLDVQIASVRDKRAIKRILCEVMPDTVFHAAAHKHVPLMERSPKEAIKNNIFGTLNVTQAAKRCNVKKVVLISTDKAVNPTNVMGATKRVCEMIVQSLNKGANTDLVAVRFGNVLGSNGSVIPLFKKQIEEGGPVTVTHPDIIRYFMTIPEAASLVVQAGAMAQGGEIFILDMGEPVKIVDLAKNLIRFSGFEPDVEIPIKITGLRPGEKLFEELLLDKESAIATKNEKIYIEQATDISYKKLLRKLRKLEKLIENGSNEDVVAELKRIVPTFVDNTIE